MDVFGYVEAKTKETYSDGDTVSLNVSDHPDLDYDGGELLTVTIQSNGEINHILEVDEAVEDMERTNIYNVLEHGEIAIEELYSDEFEGVTADIGLVESFEDEKGDLLDG